MSKGQCLHKYSSRHWSYGGARGLGACGGVGCSWRGVSVRGKCYGWGVWSFVGVCGGRGSPIRVGVVFVVGV